MEFQVKSFLELNLIIDATLLLVFCFTVLLHNPRLLIFIVFLNLCQYVVWVPDAEILEAHEKLQAEKREAFSTTDQLPGPLQSVQLYDHVLQGLGAGSKAATQSIEISLDTWSRTAEENEERHQDGISLDLFFILKHLATDPHAAWFVARLFWLAATFYLYIQRPQVGVVVFSLNLLPLPFLSRFVPYLWYRFNQQEWVKDLNARAEAGSLPEGFLESLSYWSLVVVILALPLVWIGWGLWSQRQDKKDQGLRHYLDPLEYDLLIEGLKTPFSIEGYMLRAGDFHLDVRQLSYEPDNPHIWYLKTGTKIVFSPKSSTQAESATASSTAYSDRSWRSRR